MRPATPEALIPVIAMRLAVLLILPALSGCVGLAVAGAGAVTTGKGKTPVDHTISWIEGKDCSSTRSRQGLSYCVEDEAQPAYAAHCYRTLGDVTCYTESRPFPGRQAPVHGDAAIIAALPPQAVVSRDVLPQGLPPASNPLAPTPSNTN
jgi:hypothetical protein